MEIDSIAWLISWIAVLLCAIGYGLGLLNLLNIESNRKGQTTRKYRSRLKK